MKVTVLRPSTCQVEKDMGSGCFSEKVIEGNFELGVGTLEMCRCPLMICTWASRKAFKSSLTKMELVTNKPGVSPFTTNVSWLPISVRGT